MHQIYANHIINLLTARVKDRLYPASQESTTLPVNGLIQILHRNLSSEWKIRTFNYVSQL